MPVIDTLQSSSKEMKHTQDSRIAIPSNHCITFSKYGKHGDMRGVEKSSPKLSTLGTYQPKLWDGGGQNLIIQLRISQLNATPRLPPP